MTSDLEIEDYFMRRQGEIAISTDTSVSLLSKHLKGCVPDGHHTGIEANKFSAGVNPFTEVKYIHIGKV